MTRPLWPTEEESTGNELRALLEDAAAAISEDVREDRYGLLEIRLHARSGRIRTYVFGVRDLPLCGTNGWRFLSRYAPEELDLITVPGSPRGMLNVMVRGAHRLGDLSAEEERDLCSRFRLTPDDVRRELGTEDENLGAPR